MKKSKPIDEDAFQELAKFMDEQIAKLKRINPLLIHRLASQATNQIMN